VAADALMDIRFLSEGENRFMTAHNLHTFLVIQMIAFSARLLFPTGLNR
jgi:hypothetical protein